MNAPKMSKPLSFLILLLSSIAAIAAPLEIVVTVPDIADITRRVGGDAVDVFAIASGRENPHNVPLKPSAITRLQQADLFMHRVISPFPIAR